ncbi:MAG: biotin transporter BioY [Lachnospiraceae bacterium]|nr:biotin transporter BioY [Lachnospiraceae bacterium]
MNAANQRPAQERNGKRGGRKLSTRTLVYIGMFAAVLSVLSQISIPMPTGMPLTLQTFAVALTGAVLGWRLSLASTAVWVLLGAVGVPVFANFSGGFRILVGYTGGFIWGFFFMAALCGIGSAMKNKPFGLELGFLGLLICHALGSLQYALIANVGFLNSVLLVSVPYLVKDVLSVVLAFSVGAVIRRRLARAGLS